MSRHDRHSVLGQLVRGAIAGGLATWVMDQVTTGVMSQQSSDIGEREKAVQPNRQPSVENLVDRAADSLGVSLDAEQKGLASQVTHYALGAVPGAAYAVMRDRLPIIGAGRGLLYGALVFAINDEYLNTRLGLAASPDAYPTETHLRGLIGHLALGVATDTGIDILGG
jgi:hypothetical protein